MNNQHVLYPEKIYLVKEDRVQDGSIETLKQLKEDAEAYLVPRRGEEGVTFSVTRAGFQVRERGQSGKLLALKSFETEYGVSFTINLGRWNLEIESLIHGMHPSAVKDDITASIDAADDATVEGIEFIESLLREEFTVLFEFPEEPSTGKKLYRYIPKADVNPSDTEQNMNVQQIQSAMNFQCLSLDNELTPDPVLAHQKIYENVNHESLKFDFYGKIDGSV